MIVLPCVWTGGFKHTLVLNRTDSTFFLQYFRQGRAAAGVAAHNLRMVSHLVQGAAYHFVGHGTEIVRCHTSSGTALTEILEEKCAVCAL